MTRIAVVGGGRIGEALIAGLREAGTPASDIVVIEAVQARADELAKKYNIGIISNIDDKMLGISRRHLRTDLDLVVTAQQVRSYKPDDTHFKECARRIGGKKGWLHIGSNYDTDVAPLLKMKVPVIWVNRHGEKLAGRKKPSLEVKTFRDAVKKLGAGGRLFLLSSPIPGGGGSGPRLRPWLALRC